MELIIGDAIISNPIRWALGTIEFKVGPMPAPTLPTVLRGVRPEIKHMFREPEKRPPQIISSTFTAFALAPMLVLFIMWGKLGINIKNFRFSLSALLFHGGLAGKVFFFTFI